MTSTLFRTALLLLLSGPATAALSQPVDSPAVKPGDSWTYRSTIERKPEGWKQVRNELVVTRVSSSSIYYAVKEAGSTQAPRELVAPLDWSRVRSIDGKETVVNKPLSFPLVEGKSWEVAYVEPHPNKVHKSEQWASTFKVVGTEAVEVPAGKFNALKIEAEGKWTAELEPRSVVVQGAAVSGGATTMVTQAQKTAAGVTATGRLYKAFWYAPDVKRWVKEVEEIYDAGGVRTERTTDELEAFKVAN